MQPTQFEEWRSVVGREGEYEVSNLGRVRSLDRWITRSTGAKQLYRGKQLKPYPNVRTGHLFVNLGRGNSRWVHQLVLEAFVGPRGDMVCRHLDGNPENNHLSNLAWGTQAENIADMVRHGRSAQANKTQCPQGHPYDDANTSVRRRKDGGIHRICKACKNAGERAKRAQAKEAKRNGKTPDGATAA